MRAFLVLALCGACGDVVSTTDAGADTRVDAGVDADTRPCNQTAAFEPPVPLKEINTPDYEAVSDVSADELTIYLSSNHNVAGAQLFYARRATRTEPFGTPVPLYSPSPTYNNYSIAVTSDALTGIVASDRNGTTGEDLFVLTRSSVLASFDTGTRVLALNTATTDGSPKFSRDDGTLYFDSARAGSRDLYRSLVMGGSFGAPAPLSELNSSALDVSAVLSSDELTIYFASMRPPSSDGDIYMATRSSRSSTFSAPARVTSLNSPAFDFPAALSIDGCTLYLTSERDGSHDVFVARKPRG